MTILYFDTETRSKVNLLETGVYPYAPEAEIIIMTYAIDDGPVKAWEFINDRKMPEDLIDCFFNRKTLVVAHNAEFDVQMLKTNFGIDLPFDRVRDTKTLASSLGFAAGLAGLCKSLGFPEDQAKQKAGKALIRTFSVPQVCKLTGEQYFISPADEPEKWQDFVHYAKVDVSAMRAAWKLLPNWNYPKDGDKDRWREAVKTHWQIAELDNRINRRGLPVDLGLARSVIENMARLNKEYNDKLPALTSGFITKGTQVERIKILVNRWLEDQNRKPLKSLSAQAIIELLAESELPDDLREILKIRQFIARTSLAKYRTAIEANSSGDENHGLIRGCYQLFGASRTGRWAGYLLQPHNMPRGKLKTDGDDEEGCKAEIMSYVDAFKSGVIELVYDNVSSIASTLIRSMIAAEPDKKFCVQDFANIESRALAWLAGEEWKVKAFEEYDAGTGPDLYKLGYSKSFDVPVEEVTKPQRFIGKVQELACGYGGGVGAYKSMAALYGVQISDVDADEAKTAWRKAHPQSVKFWRQIENACMQAIRNPGNGFLAGHRERILVQVMPLQRRVSVGFEHDRYNSLVIRLPSGRVLCYHKPRIIEKPIKYTKIEDGKPVIKTSTTECIEFWGEKKQTGGAYLPWTRLETYSGKLTENIVQALCADLLIYSLLQIDKEFDIVGHTHDEVITQADKGDAQALDRLRKVMSRQPEWSAGLPIAVSGFEWDRYRKD